MLYGLLLDRMHLSAKNGWTDKRGRIYQFFTVKEAQEKLRFGHEKNMQTVLGIGTGRPDSPQTAGTGKTEPHLLKKVLTSDFRTSKFPKIRSY